MPPSPAESPPFPAGDRFELLAEVGPTPAGRRYRVFDRRAHGIADLDTLEHLTGGEVRRRLERLAAIHHEGLAHVWDAGSAGDTAWILHEPLRGPRLDDRLVALLRDDRRRRAARLVDRLLDALERLAEAELAHGALAAANVHVEVGQRLVTAGWGLAADDDPASHDDLADLGRLLAGILERPRLPPASEDWLRGLLRTLRRPEASRESVRAHLQPLLSHEIASAPLADASRSAGRNVELEHLVIALDKTRAGASGVIFVRSRPAMGRTGLLARLAGEVQERSLVLAGICRERDEEPAEGDLRSLDVPLRELIRFLASLPRHDAEVLLPSHVLSLAATVHAFHRLGAVAAVRDPEPETPDPATVRRRAAAALRQLLDRVAARRPVLLLLEDVHHADAATVDFLLHLVSPPDPPPLLVVLGFESGSARGRPFQRLLDARLEATFTEIEEVVLSPLPSDVLDRPDASQLARGFLRKTPDDRQEPADPETQEPADELGRDLDDDERARRHRQLARDLEAELEGSGAETARFADRLEVARHFLAGGLAPNARRHALEAAGKIEPDDAASCGRVAEAYAIALRTLPEGDGERAALLRRQAELLDRAGRLAEAARAYEETATGADAGSLRLRAIDCHLGAGERSRARKLAAELARAVGLPSDLLPLVDARARGFGEPAPGYGPSLPGPGGHLRRRLRQLVLPLLPARDAAAETTAIELLWTLCRDPLGRDPLLPSARAWPVLVSEHLARARRAREPGRLARALALEGLRRARRGDEAREPSHSALSLARRQDDPPLHGVCQVVAAETSLALGQADRALSGLDRAEPLLAGARPGARASRRFLTFLRLRTFGLLGRWMDQRRDLEEAVDDATRDGDDVWASRLDARFGWWIALLDDDPKAAHRSLEAEPGPRVPTWWRLRAEVEIDLYTGHPNAAWTRLNARWDQQILPALELSALERREALLLYGRTALAVARADGAPYDPDAPTYGRVHQMAGGLRDRDAPTWSRAWAHALSARLAELRDDAGEGRRARELAARAFREAAFEVHAAVVAGDGLDRLRAEGAKRPERIAALLLP